MKKILLKDIAEKLGVSVSQVSRTLNNREIMDAPEFVSGEPFRIGIHFYRGSRDVNDIRLTWRLPEGWSCSEQTQYLFITRNRTNERVYFDLLPSENTLPLDYAELVIGRNGHTCEDVIRLPLQRKGFSHASLEKEEPHIYDYGLLNSRRTTRNPWKE